MRLPTMRRRMGFPYQWCIPVLLAVGTIISSPVQAAESGPWECSNYTGEAHARCLQAMIEIQREKISKLEAEVQVQQSTASQLRDQADRQKAMAADLQRQMSEQSSSIRPYSYVAPGLLYGYPSVGFGLYLGRPWLYGSPYYGRPYAWGPRYYRPYFGPWHRHW